MRMIPTCNTTATPWVANFDRLFDSLLGASRQNPDDDVAVFERDDAWVLRVDLPGFRKDDIEVSIEDGTLSLRAASEDETRPFREEIRRDWSLGEDVASDNVGAKLEHGVLELTLPKQELPAPAKHNIEIR